MATEIVIISNNWPELGMPGLLRVGLGGAVLAV
jgi:hypothetical protein